MVGRRAWMLLAIAGQAARAAADSASPIAKVLSMISDLQAKVLGEGEVAQKEYAEFAEWCSDRARDISHEIKTGKGQVESLKSTIEETTAKITALTTKVDELAASVSSNEADLKKAKKVREKEHADFSATEKELMETVDMIRRAQEVLEREAAKGGPSLLQARSTGDLVQAFSALVEASLIDGADAARLTAFVQDTQAQKADDADDDAAAPKAAAYENKSANIIETLQDLQDKAEAQLEEARKKETAAANNFEMMAQSLKDEIRFAKRDLDDAKKSIAANTETQSSAQGELQATTAELAADVKSKAALHHDCMTRAEDFEAETKSRGDELKALATAKQVIAEATGGGASAAAASFLQVAARARAKARAASGLALVRKLRHLAQAGHSAALAQLATRVAAAMRGSADPFEKIRGLITDMITKLEEEAGAEATKHAYCQKELKETNEKKGDKSDEVEGLTTKLDKAAAKSEKLKEEVAVLQNELAKLTKSQAEMDKLRQEQNKAFLANKAELEKGLKGLRLALQVLKEYYAQDGGSHDKADGGASGIIGLIEVCESDFSKNLAEIVSEEEAAATEYEAVSGTNAVEKAAKEKDVEYKVKESKELDKTGAELKGDRSNVQAELDAVLEYLSKIENECGAKPEPYEERVARRAAELAGLKDALQTLEAETALLQRGAARHRLRGRGVGAAARPGQGALRAE